MAVCHLSRVDAPSQGNRTGSILPVCQPYRHQRSYWLSTGVSAVGVSRRCSVLPGGPGPRLTWSMAHEAEASGVLRSLAVPELWYDMLIQAGMSDTTAKDHTRRMRA